MPEPKTAEEALKSWRLSRQYIEDPESGESIEELWKAAYLTVTLSTEEGQSLEILVPDKEERNELLEDKACYDEMLIIDPDDFDVMGDVDEEEYDSSFDNDPILRLVRRTPLIELSPLAHHIMIAPAAFLFSALVTGLFLLEKPATPPRTSAPALRFVAQIKKFGFPFHKLTKY